MNKKELLKLKELAGNVKKEDYDFLYDFIDDLSTEIKSDKISNYYSYAQEQLLIRVKNGEIPIKVINDLSREFSSFFNNSIDMFNLFFDAMTKKAWQFGIKCVNEESPKNKMINKK